jgi:cytochrome c
MWVAIVPLVIIAFLLTYLHKYTWHSLEENKALHISIIALAVIVFLFIPLIFLTNINLMLFPEKWGSVRGFVSAMTMDNVFPRYLHFLFASLAVTGLFLFWYIGRKSYPFEEYFKTLTRYDIKKKAYSLTLAASVAQFIMGPLVLITLPSKGIGYNLIITIFSGALIALLAMWWMWKAITGPEEKINEGFVRIAIAITVTVLLMGSGRHLYRANALAPHQRLMAAKTKEFLRQVEEAKAAPVEKKTEVLDSALGELATGAAVFKQNCAICHKKDEKLVGPPMLEMVSIYKNDLKGLKNWIKRPGKKREGFPQMPGFPQLSDKDLDELTKFILATK